MDKKVVDNLSDLLCEAYVTVELEYLNNQKEINDHISLQKPIDQWISFEDYVKLCQDNKQLDIIKTNIQSCLDRLEKL